MCSVCLENEDESGDLIAFTSLPRVTIISKN